MQPIVCSLFFPEQPNSVQDVQAEFKQFVTDNFSGKYEFGSRSGSLTLLAVEAATLASLTLFCHAVAQELGKRTGADIYTLLSRFLRGDGSGHELIESVPEKNKKQEIMRTQAALAGIPLGPLENMLARIDDLSKSKDYYVDFIEAGPSGTLHGIKIHRADGDIKGVEIYRKIPFDLDLNTDSLK